MWPCGKTNKNPHKVKIMKMAEAKERKVKKACAE